MIFDPATHPGDLLSALVDSELAPETAAKVDIHLATCPDCQADLDELQATRAALRSSPRLAAPDGFTLGLVRARRRASRRGAALALGAAAAAVVAGLVLAPVRPDTSSDHPSLSLQGSSHYNADAATGVTTPSGAPEVQRLTGNGRAVPAIDSDDGHQSLGDRVSDAVGALLDAIGG